MSFRIRPDGLAGSWYEDDPELLNEQLEKWLSAAKVSPSPCKAIIAPHAGYFYSGATAAYAYKCVDTSKISRVFILGPSHRAYLETCALTKYHVYATPLGDLPVDRSTVEELEATGKFSVMSSRVDSEEHSIEMHLPYIRKVFQNKSVQIVPILVGALTTPKELFYGSLLADYLASPDTFFVISSDFCHWGSRFSYTYYQPSPHGDAALSTFNALTQCDGIVPDLSPGYYVSRSTLPLKDFPIHKAIALLDLQAIRCLTIPEFGAKTPSEAQSLFSQYLKRTDNTICGRHPIGVLLGALIKATSLAPVLTFTHYEQSSKVVKVNDSSVSYAAAVIRDI